MAEIEERVETVTGMPDLTRRMNKFARQANKRAEERQFRQLVCKRIMTIIKLHAKDTVEKMGGTISVLDVQRQIAKHYGADYDDGKFWHHNTNPLTFIPKMLRYRKLYRRAAKYVRENCN